MLTTTGTINRSLFLIPSRPLKMARQNTVYAGKNIKLLQYVNLLGLEDFSDRVIPYSETIIVTEI